MLTFFLIYMIKQEIIKIKNNSACKFREFVINLILKEDSPLDCLLDLKKYGVQNYGFSNLIYNQDILKVFEKYQDAILEINEDNGVDFDENEIEAVFEAVLFVCNDMLNRLPENARRWQIA